MSTTIRRKLATLCCHALEKVLPAQLECWGWAIRYEVADIPDDTEALLFALESLWSLLPRAIAFRLFGHLPNAAAGHQHFSGSMIEMRFLANMTHYLRGIGIACAVGAVGLGLIYMRLAGAPDSYLGMNAVALILGLTFFTLLTRFNLASHRWIGAAILILAVGLFTTALVGTRVDGAARWLKLGPLYIQPSLILLPVMIIGFARTRDKLSATGLMIAAAAMALQPDRAMAAMLVAGMTPLALVRPDRPTILALVVSMIAFAVTLVRPDTLSAMPYVDQILYSSFDVSMVAGLCVMAGSTLLIVPAIIGILGDPDNREIHGVFAAVWVTAIAAAALGNYPTPVVGYSGAAVLGYILSLVMLPTFARLSRRTVEQLESTNTGAVDHEQNWRLGRAA
jgi:Cell cycle protein